MICQTDLVTFQIEGEVEKDSLAKATYQDLHAKRPICAKLLDHNNQIIDTSLAEEEDTEYQSTINKLQVILEVVLTNLKPDMQIEKTQ